MEFRTKYPFISVERVKKLEPIAELLNVSQIARGKTNKPGFVKVFYDHGENMPLHWLKKREGFIARTLASQKLNPSLKRKISLAMWAYED